MHRCRFCLCRSCMNTCSNCGECNAAVKSCERHREFKQLNLFDSPQPQRKKLIRDYTWQDYGISKARYRELRDICRSGKYDALVRQSAHRAAPDIEWYIYLSVVKNKSYRALEVKWDLGEMERMPYNHNDFYGYRRLFYYLFDERIRENGEINY